ncbi:type I restriction enzyme S subunit [Gillisia mitskevichiae]|uniref:Type I restriction enzyme S subunit n=1 Tax=Gillisia mitskevichiae TaxID=270921 RepID=A0A495PZC8_9FLAO|nr:restriction endonuclease subunit S [Gillisia mitskevichiae]RKS55877.1 type I restriction enzyme S subunit [Gillisia mitskevichiae]
MIEELKLSDLITLQRGFDITKSEQVDGPFPVISSGGISSYHNKFKVKGPGIVIGRKGTLGKVFYCKHNFWPHDTSLWVKDFKGNDPKFIYYFLQVLHFEKFDAGAANPTLNRNHIHSLKLTVPKKEFRSKIASILSAYDDLIENNNKRIELLEEMAEEIYKEWFVRFRFPGYGNSKFFDKEGKEVPHGTKGALPDGWEIQPINKIVDIISGYAFKSDTFEEEGDYKLVTIKNVQNGFFVTKTSDCIKELPKNLKKNIFLKDKDILLSLTGNIGRICLVYGDNYLLNQRVAKLKPKTENLFEYVYLFFRSDFLRKTLENHSNGAAQQNLSPVDMSELKFLTPNDNLLEKFSSITKSLFEEIIILLKKNQILQETRDLLLPRLISGKLSLEDLEIEQMNMAAEPQPEYYIGKNSMNE